MINFKENFEKVLRHFLCCFLFIFLFYFFFLIPLPLFAVEPTNRDPLKKSMICALDMGSNSFKFMIAEMINQNYIQHIKEIRDTLGVGDDISNSKKLFGEYRISNEKIRHIQNVLLKYQSICKQKVNTTKIYAVATAAFRQAVNKSELESMVNQLGIEIEIVDGKRESQLAYEATVFGKPHQAVVDLGSRSTEFVTREDKGETSYKEFNTGYKTAYKDHFENKNSFLQARNSYQNYLKNIIHIKDFDILNKKEKFYIIEGSEMASFILGSKERLIEGVVLPTRQIKAKILELDHLNEKGYHLLRQNSDMDKILPRLVFIDYLLNELKYDHIYFTLRELYAGIVFEKSQLK